MTRLYQRVWNFNPGPAALPLEVLERAHSEWFNYGGSGMNVMEMSHRGKDYETIHNRCISFVKELLELSDRYSVLLLQGGASLQFAMIPINFLSQDKSADYIYTGDWAKKAINEAKRVGKVHQAYSGESHNFTRLPTREELDLDPGAVYVHITSNETIRGIEFFEYPDTGEVPLVADMSSDIMSHWFDASRFALIYAGAQKNIGPAGVTLVIIRDDFLEKARTDLPVILSYQTHAKENSLYHTPPTFAIYIMSLTLEWLKAQGGLRGIERINRAKAETLYTLIDQSGGFYRGTVDPRSRSWMNVCLRLPNEMLEEQFVKEGKENGFVGLKGHRSVGGIRVSLYNAVPLQAVEELAQFMKEFQRRNG
ncbi:MAG: 3-phosphoserine/phosphohydroxythreonine transaminase [bacterium]